MNTHISTLFLRLSFGLTMAFSHGLPKIMNYSSMKNNFPDPIGIGNSASLILVIFAEFFCALFISLGIKVRLSTIPLIITMLIAAFVINIGDSWNKIEFPLLYVFAYLAIFINGGGKYCISKK